MADEKTAWLDGFLACLMLFTDQKDEYQRRRDLMLMMPPREADPPGTGSTS
jgi:hypothetical protein